jgi:hypothetical protein
VGDYGYTTGRAVSLGATGISAVLLGASVKHLTGRWWIGLLAAGLFLTQNLTAMLWASLARVDVLALAFTLGGLLLATVGRKFLAVPLFVLAILTKQTFFIAPAVVFLALWPCRREMFRFAALMVFSLLVCIAIAEWLTGGWFLWHTVAANANETDLNTFAMLAGSFLQFNGLPVVAALASLLFPSAPGERVWRLYFLACLATLPTIAKLGASSNYWLECTAAAAVLLALAAQRLAQRSETQLIAPVILVGALLIPMPAYQFGMTDFTENTSTILRPPPVAYVSLVSDSGPAPLRVNTAFIEQLRRQPGELLTDNSGLAVAAGKRIAFEFQIFQLLQVEGRWSDEPIIRSIIARRFALVALMHPLDAPVESTRWTVGIQDALRAAYTPVGQEAGFWLYRSSS